MLSGWRIAVGCLAIGACIATEVGAAVKPVVTNKSRFRIPFRFDPAALQRMNARELQLFVSPNKGASWELSQSINPQTAKFEFQAPSDGEYWFSVRTIDAYGGQHPPGARPEAGLIVVVDSIPPSLAVNVEQTAPGKIQLSWSASDANLDISTLRLEYLQPDQNGWEAVSVVPTQRGMTAWTIATGGRIAVRASVADLAGNMGQTKSEIEATAGKPEPGSPKPALRVPIAESPKEDLLTESMPRLEMPEPKPVARSPEVVPREVARIPEPAATEPALPGPRKAATPLVSSGIAERPTVLQDRWPSVTPGNEASSVYRLNNRQKVVNTRRFQLGYKVDDVGPSGVGGVDLFITPDGGRSWFRYGEDADKTSPFEVSVPKDGEYGFTVRVRSGAGLGLEPPAPGEPPSIQVVVDQTPPRLELLPIRQGQGSELNQITIEWRITDERPSPEPVSLYYSASPQGPWEPISGWRKDSGQFTWTVGAGAPPQLYVRVVARDAAGNLAQAETTQPVVVDLARPSARIVDVEIMPGSGPQ